MTFQHSDEIFTKKGCVRRHLILTHCGAVRPCSLALTALPVTQVSVELLFSASPHEAAPVGPAVPAQAGRPRRGDAPAPHEQIWTGYRLVNDPVAATLPFFVRGGGADAIWQAWVITGIKILKAWIKAWSFATEDERYVNTYIHGACHPCAKHFSSYEVPNQEGWILSYLSFEWAVSKTIDFDFVRRSRHGLIMANIEKMSSVAINVWGY